MALEGRISIVGLLLRSKVHCLDVCPLLSAQVTCLDVTMLLLREAILKING